MEQLVPVVGALTHARDIGTIAALISDFARKIAESDGATFVLREDGDMGHCVAESAETPQWTGRRFPLETALTGRVILSGEPLTIADTNNHPWVKPGTFDPAILTSLAVVPIRRTKPIGAICLYWRGRSHVPVSEELAILQALADLTSVAWENVRLLGDLEDKIKRLEEQQARINEQHETLEVFTHALAHDLREPVRTVRAFTDMIVEDGGLPESAATYFDFVRRGADRMGQLIETVFTYTQLHDPTRVKKARCSMDAALNAARENLHSLISESGAKIDAATLPEVEANDGQMMQLFQNLISNAIKHCPQPVTITITVSPSDKGWKFCVGDDGCGIAETDIERIFQPFKRLNLNEDGTGLGLAICAKIIAAHGGRIWCESKEGEGASFCFTLPRAA
jgi:signal transduction histidine kinase